MKPVTPKRQRCAVYTRKSTEHNLDLAFNSLDAQREACEAYIKSQAHEGWSLVPTAFDDGGLSGASLDRPALQHLLDAVRARKVDIVVVYKVDRLTRALADFAKLVELFDAHDVSFVSVTQSFNTTSSMGRLTLNVLLSFAQFEREVIGERVRDKIAASKRKGIWVGGPVPLGYRSENKVLVVVPDEAELVRRIFSGYLRLGSIVALAAWLYEEGIRPKPRPGNGKAAARFTVGPLAHMLKNRFYVGEVAYRGEIHPGSQPPIVDRATFDAVQAILAKRAVRRSELRSSSPALLTGVLHDDRGGAMTPTHAKKKGVRYRYYTSHALLQGQREAAGSVKRVSAPDIEGCIVAALRARQTKAAASTEVSDRDLVAAQLARATLTAECVILLMHDVAGELRIPFHANAPRRKGIAHAPVAAKGAIDDATRTKLLTAIARSRRWLDRLTSSQATVETIARDETLIERHVRFLLPLAFVSHRIVDAIADGLAPADLTVTDLARALPLSWAQQEKQLGFA